MDEIIKVKPLRKYFPLENDVEVLGIVKFKGSFVKEVSDRLAERIKMDDSLAPHIIFLVDTSLSMKEQDVESSKIESLKKGIRKFVEYGYLDNCYLSLVTFDEDAEILFEYIKVKENKEFILRKIDSIYAKGFQTYAYTGFSLINREITNYNHNGVSRVIYFTDGEDFDTELACEEAENLVYSKHFTITSVGVGISYNEEFLEDIANIGRGGFYHLKNVESFFGDIKDEIKEIGEEIITNTEIVILFHPTSVEPVEVYKVGRGVVKLDINKGEILCGNITERDRIFFRFRLKNVRREGKYTILNAFIRFKSGGDVFEKEFSFQVSLTKNKELVDSQIDPEVIELNKQIAVYKKVKEAQQLFNMGREKEARTVINEVSHVLKSLNPDTEISQLLEDIKNGKSITSEITRTLLSFTRTKTLTKTNTE